MDKVVPLNRFVFVDEPEKTITDEENRIICRLGELRVATKDIADIFGVSQSTIQKRLLDAGIRRKKGRKPDGKKSGRNEQIVALYKRGYTLNEIGQAYNITRERVRQILNKLGVNGSDGGASVRAIKNQEKREKERLERRDAKAQFYWGVDYETLCRLRKNQPDDVENYEQQRHNALSRGIDWDLSITQWLDIWDKSGKKHLRGRSANSYVLTRKKATGPFSAENCIVTKLTESSKNFILNQVHGVDYDPDICD